MLAGLLELIVFPGGQLPRRSLQDTDKFWHRGFEGTSGRSIVKTTFQHSAGFTVTKHTFSVSYVLSLVTNLPSGHWEELCFNLQPSFFLKFWNHIYFICACMSMDVCEPQRALEARGQPAESVLYLFHKRVLAVWQEPFLAEPSRWPPPSGLSSKGHAESQG